MNTKRGHPFPSPASEERRAGLPSLLYTQDADVRWARRPPSVHREAGRGDSEFWAPTQAPPTHGAVTAT